ncbi:MAG: ROK family protein [Burkholderiales bacterium]|nr:ROK family protein [Burkholderiales bacterium]
MKKVYAAIEAGGTKFNCAVGTSDGDILASTRIETKLPDETFTQVLNFFQAQSQNYQIESLGIGSFGPIDADINSPTYGYITSTPKPGWNNTNIVGFFAQHLKLPIVFDTDVNAAAIGEHRLGHAQSLNNFVYITIGTGIGGGIFCNGKIISGKHHPEIGHMFIPSLNPNDIYTGICPFHSNCLEGYASGPAMIAKWNINDFSTISPDHIAWEYEAQYIAYALANLILTLAPERIILGGGVMNNKFLISKIRLHLLKIIANYIDTVNAANIDSYIMLPKLTHSGLVGSLVMAIME